MRPVAFGPWPSVATQSRPAESIAQLSGMPNQPLAVVAVEKVAPTSATDGIAAFQQHFPLALGGGEVAAVLGDLDDVAEGVFGARVGGVDLLGLALGVVGQHDIDLAVDGVGLDVLGPVHLGGAEQVAGAARLDQHVGLAGKAVLGGQRALAVDERQPFDRAVLGEFGDVERAVVEQVHVGGAVVRR